jgi:tRNA(Ile)-lysidine synthase
LLHLMRGAGLDGLAAAPLVQVLPRAAWGLPLDDGELPATLPVVRPLLAVSRADTAAYCAEQGLQPVGEQVGHYRRDRVRHDLLPALEQYNPAVRRALAAAAFALAEERAALDQWTTALWHEFGGGESRALSIPLEEWRRLPAAMRKRLIRRMVVELAGPAGDLGRRSQAAVMALADRQAGRGVDLPGGLRLERTPTHLCLGSRVWDLAPPPGPWALAVPGEVILPGVGTLRVEHCGPDVLPEVPPAGRACPNEAWLDANSVRLPLQVRWRRRGDRFQPLGMDRAKRLQDFLVDCRVPRARRDSLPLVVAGEAGEEIVWVVGERIAHPARLRPSTRDVLHLTFEPAVSSEGDLGA